MGSTEDMEHTSAGTSPGASPGAASMGSTSEASGPALGDCGNCGSEFCPACEDRKYLYQDEGVARMLRQERTPTHGIRGGILADEPGLGKTIQVLRLIFNSSQHIATNNPTLVCMPPGLVDQWVRQCRLWLVEDKWGCVVREEWDPLVVDFRTAKTITRDEVQNKRLVFATYTSFSLETRAHPLLGITFQRVVFDEAHNLKTPKSMTATFALMLQAQAKWCMTATPVTNKKFQRRLPTDAGHRTTDLIALFAQLLAKPGVSKKTIFARARIAKDPDVVEKLMIRRTKEDVPADLPPLHVATQAVELTQQEMDELDAHKKEAHRILEEMSDRPEDRGRLLVKIGQMRKTCAVAPTKIRAAADIVRQQPPGQKVLVFANFEDEVDALVRAVRDQGVQCLVYDGRTKNKDAVVKEYKTQQNTTIMVMNYAAGSEGLNLAETRLVVLNSPHWAATTEQQAMGRAHRIDTKHPVHVIRLAAQQTIEQFIQKRQQAKLQTAAKLLKDKRILCKQYVPWGNNKDMLEM
jgi:SNF2 family DNA or RNA helicase